jgi:hypothetical protein
MFNLQPNDHPHLTDIFILIGLKLVSGCYEELLKFKELK